MLAAIVETRSVGPERPDDRVIVLGRQNQKLGRRVSPSA